MMLRTEPRRFAGRSIVFRGAMAVAACAAVFAVTPRAHAVVTHEGDWGDVDDEPEISLDLDHVARGEAVRRVAKAAGWSVVLETSPDDIVDVHVNDQPASKALDLVLASGDYVARRDGDLVSIRKAAAGAPRPPAPPAPPPPPARGADRMITGSSYTVERSETVHDLAVFGGSLEVDGTVTGDVLVTGGSVKVRRGARIFGDLSAVGGSVDIEDGASVMGDVEANGGSVHKGKSVELRGDVRQNTSRGHRHDHDRHGKGHDHEHEHEDATTATAETASAVPPASLSSRASRAFRDARAAVVRTALLFVFGAVLLALFTPRMETIRVQVAAKPMRTIATGILGLIALVIGAVALSVTIIGIPFAIIGLLLAFVAAVAGVASVLETVGCALFGHYTKNPYAHLALGCVLFLLVGAIPFVGGIVKLLVLLAGVGAMVATRAGGIIRRRLRAADSYRSAPDFG